MAISPNDQATLRQKLYIEDEEHVFYGKYKLPENPTNDIASQRHALELPKQKTNCLNLAHVKRICNSNGKVLVLITTKY